MGIVPGQETEHEIDVVSSSRMHSVHLRRRRQTCLAHCRFRCLCRNHESLLHRPRGICNHARLPRSQAGGIYQSLPSLPNCITTTSNERKLIPARTHHNRKKRKLPFPLPNKKNLPLTAQHPSSSRSAPPSTSHPTAPAAPSALAPTAPHHTLPPRRPTAGSRRRKR